MFDNKIKNAGRYPGQGCNKGGEIEELTQFAVIFCSQNTINHDQKDKNSNRVFSGLKPSRWRLFNLLGVRGVSRNFSSAVLEFFLYERKNLGGF